MNEVEFINSRAKQVRSPHHWPPTAKNIGASDVTKESQTRLTREERKAVITVLRNFTDKLAIYRSILNETDSDHNEMIIKLRDNILYMSNILDELINEIEISGSYNVLIREIENDKKRRNDEIAVARDYEETQKNVAELRKKLEEEIEANSREREELKAKLAHTKNETKRIQYKANIESRYVQAREEARRESNALRWSVKLKKLEDTLKYLSLKEKNEQRVAENIAKFLKENIAEHERATVEWRERYERDMLMYDSSNEHLRKEIKNRREELEKLQLEYSEKQAFIDSYLAEKEAAKELKKHETRRHDCAIKIQAWWRGVMVRRKLGPYRPDEKKKKRPVKSKK